MIQSRSKHGADVYTSSKKAYDQFKSETGFRGTFKEFKDCIIELNKYYINYMLESANMIILPYGMGKLGIQKGKRKVFYKLQENGIIEKISWSINWGKTKKEGKLVYNTNEHSDGYTFSYKWLKTEAKFTNPSFWKMKMSQFAKDELKARILHEDINYKDLYRERAPGRLSKIIKKNEYKELYEKQQRELNER